MRPFFERWVARGGISRSPAHNLSFRFSDPVIIFTIIAVNNPTHTFPPLHQPFQPHRTRTLTSIEAPLSAVHII